MLLETVKAKLAPYLLGLKVGILLILLFGAYAKGCSDGRGRGAEEIAKKNQALTEAAAALTAAGAAIAEINAEAVRRQDEAAKAKALADLAGTIVETQRLTLARERDQFRKDVATARRNPSCAALLDADLAKVCGL